MVRTAMLMGVVSVCVAMMCGCASRCTRDQVIHQCETETLKARRVSREEAALLATAAARLDGYDVAFYESTFKRARDGWWVYFERSKPEENPTQSEVILGGDNHFSVMVYDDGTTRVAGGR